MVSKAIAQAEVDGAEIPGFSSSGSSQHIVPMRAHPISAVDPAFVRDLVDMIENVSEERSVVEDNRVEGALRVVEVGGEGELAVEVGSSEVHRGFIRDLTDVIENLSEEKASVVDIRAEGKEEMYVG